MVLKQVATPGLDAPKAYFEQAKQHYALLGPYHPEALTSMLLAELSMPQPLKGFGVILQFLKAGGEVEFSLDGDRQGVAWFADNHALVRTRRKDE